MNITHIQASLMRENMSDLLFANIIGQFIILAHSSDLPMKAPVVLFQPKALYDSVIVDKDGLIFSTKYLLT